MIHFGLFAVRTDVFVSVLSIILLAIQIILCCNAKNKTVKLIPVYLLSLSTIIFVILAFLHDDWNRFGYLVLAVFAAVLLLICGLGWLVWSLIKHKQNRM